MARIKGNSSKIAFNYIKENIDKYNLQPGDTVSDFVISQYLGISRTPVREAIQLLIQYNLIEKQRTKFVVKGISNSDITEILECREAIECQASNLIIDNGGLSVTQQTELKKIVKKIEVTLKNKNYYLNFKNDTLFHTKLVEYSGNTRLIKMMANLTMQGERLRWLSILTPERYSSAVYEHNEIMNQIKSNNKVKARECIFNHLNLTKATYEKATKNSSLDEIIMAFKQLNQEVKISSNTVK